MQALLMAFTLASAPPELPLPPPHPQWSEQPFRMAVLATSYGDAAVLEGEAVYEAEGLRLRAAAAYETYASAFLPDVATISVSAGRRLSRRERFDVEVRRGFGGLGGLLTLRRAF
jgi:hypothetical protein